MIRKPILSVLALAAFAAGAPLAAQAPAGDPSQRVAAAMDGLRARIAADPALAARAEVALARLATLQGTMAAQRHVQGGVLSADQQARALARLEAYARTGR